MDKENKNIPQIRFPGFKGDWECRRLGEIFKYEQPGPYIVSSVDYNDNYKTPVLTAGQSFVLGYTNETNGIKNASKNEPVIIFDDFTTSSHYVDFPFKVKSSAMKLLTLRDEKDDIYFMGNILKNIDYIPKAHERHWISIFSNFDVLIPQNIEEQQKIGSYFKQLDQLISISEQELNGYKELKKSMMQKLFSQEVRFKRDDGSDYPDWEEKAFNTIFIEYNNKNSNGYSQYTAGKYGLKLIDEEKIRYDISKHKSFHKNTLILGIGIEEVGVSIDIDGCVSPIYTTFDIVNADSKFISYFIKQCFDKNKGKITHKSTRRDYEFETKELSSLNIYLPKSIEEQQKIGLYFNQLDNLISITMQELNEYKRLKKCMLQKMFC